MFWRISVWRSGGSRKAGGRRSLPWPCLCIVYLAHGADLGPSSEGCEVSMSKTAAAAWTQEQLTVRACCQPVSQKRAIAQTGSCLSPLKKELNGPDPLLEWSINKTPKAVITLRSHYYPLCMVGNHIPQSSPPFSASTPLLALPSPLAQSSSRSHCSSSSSMMALLRIL